ncbi:NYN domain-containing protein [Halochromatium roseum]|uniref:NYN domain-containing protein n=1 Tax=Halochromatium roseum TaxID=391920 RepID=UPI001912CD07|nr:NYN domain-containing protein [Halochromatium roseum]MBK5938248.1 hypothetical protein [Halochromatium roseum]
MIKKLLSIDLTPCEIVARDLGHPYFPIEALRGLIAGDGVDLIETLVTLVERVPDDNPEAIAANRMNFTRKQHALEEAGARVVPAPAKRLPDGSFKQSDDQRLVIATLSLALRLRPDFVVLAAADGDFAPMVWELRNVGIRTEVMARPQMLASDLRRAAYSIIDLDDVLNHVGGTR